MLTNATFLKESGIWNDEVVSELAEASELLTEVLNNTLDISKLEEGKIEFSKSYESIQDVLNVVLKMSRANARRKNILLTSEYDSSLPYLLEFDKSRLTQIVMNIVGNAIKFTPENGMVTVKVEWNKRKSTTQYQLLKAELRRRLPDAIESEDEVTERDHTPRNALSIDKRSTKIIQRFSLKADSGSLEIVPDEAKSQLSPKEKIEKHQLSVHFPLKFKGESNVRNLYNPNYNSVESLNSERTLHNNSARRLMDLSASCVASSKARSIMNVKEPLNNRLRSKLLTSNSDKQNIKPIKELNEDRRDTTLEGKSGKTLTSSRDEGRLQLKGLARGDCFCEVEYPPVICMESRHVRHSSCGGHKEGRLLLQVIDNGCGMTHAEQSRLFQPFSQASKTTYSKFGGTGLGLWLSHKLVAAMGGSISCESKLNEGTKFSIELPVRYRSSSMAVLWRDT